MKKGATISHVRGTVKDDYLRLVRQFPLKAIQNDRQWEQALPILEKLAVREEGSLARGEQDYFDALTELVWSYEQRRHRIDTSGRITPLSALKFLMKEAGLKAADIGRIIGSGPAATMILKGDREMSKAHIRALADHFKVNPGLFL